MAVHLELLATAVGELPDSEVSERLSRYVAVLQRESKRLLEATQTFLTLVAVAEEPSEFDLGVLLHETSEALRPLLTQRHVAIEVSRPSYPVPTTAVRERVRQDILDLVLSILDDVPSGARLSLDLTLTAGAATLTLEREQAAPAVLTWAHRAEA